MTGNLTTARRTSPRRCGRGEDRGERTLWLRELIGKPVVGPEEQHLGHVDDVAARRTDDPQGPVVTGLVTDVGGLRLFAPASAVRRWHDEQVLVDAAGLQKLRDKDNDDRILLGSIIGKPVVTRSGDVTQVGDIGLRPRPDGWAAGVADVRGRVGRLLGLPRRPVGWDELVGRRLVARRRRGRPRGRAPHHRTPGGRNRAGDRTGG